MCIHTCGHMYCVPWHMRGGKRTTLYCRFQRVNWGLQVAWEAFLLAVPSCQAYAHVNQLTNWIYFVTLVFKLQALSMVGKWSTELYCPILFLRVRNEDSVWSSISKQANKKEKTFLISIFTLYSKLPENRSWM